MKKYFLLSFLAAILHNIPVFAMETEEDVENLTRLNFYFKPNNIFVIEAADTKETRKQHQKKLEEKNEMILENSFVMNTNMFQNILKSEDRSFFHNKKKYQLVLPNEANQLSPEATILFLPITKDPSCLQNEKKYQLVLPNEASSLPPQSTVLFLTIHQYKLTISDFYNSYFSFVWKHSTTDISSESHQTNNTPILFNFWS